MTGPGDIRTGALRFFLLSAVAVLLSLVIFAMVPFLLRQTTYDANAPRASHALLIPVHPEPKPLVPEPEVEPPPEKPESPEPEIEAETPDIPEIEPPELESPDIPQPEVIRETPDMPPLESPSLEPPSPEPPLIQQPALHTVSLSALPIKSSPMNLKVNLKVGKAPAPRVLVRPRMPEKPAPAKTRFGMDELDQKPVSIAALKPHYPYRARRMGIEGYVMVRFLVDREGHARKVSIIDAEPDGVFEETVRSTVPRWRFKPGRKDGRPVDTWVEMTIRFGMEDNG